MYINKNIIIFLLILLLLIWWFVYIRNYQWFDINQNYWGNWTDSQNSWANNSGADMFSDIADWWDGTKWSENYKKLFIDACIEEWTWDNGDNKSWTWSDSINFVDYCNCIADKLESKYTIPQFLDMMDKDPDLNFMFSEVSECL